MNKRWKSSSWLAWKETEKEHKNYGKEQEEK